MIKKFVNGLAVVGLLAVGAIVVHMTGIPEAIAQATTPVTPIALPVEAGTDIAVIKDSVLSVMSALLLGIAGWVGLAIRSFFAAKYDLDKTTLDEKLQAIFDVAAKRGIAFAETSLDRKIPDKLTVDSVFVKTAADYLSSHWPDIVKKTGMTEQGVIDSIISRLPSPTAKEADALSAIKAGATAEVKVVAAGGPK